MNRLEEKISPVGHFKNDEYCDDPYLHALITKQEKIDLHIYKSLSECSKVVACEISEIIHQKEANQEKCVLGLSASPSLSEVYAELIRMNRDKKLSFKNVIIFIAYEYYPVNPDALQSFERFLKEIFIKHIDISEENIFFFDGTVKQEKVFEFCRYIETKIENLGGIDIMLLGVGPTGHIALNEPGSSLNSLTRLVSLDDITKTTVASDFYGKENVPRKALTLGIKTIMQSKKIRAFAWGEGKAPVIKRMVEGEITEEVPASFLQQHKDVKLFIDAAAGAGLTRIETPWLLDSVIWDHKMIRKAVVWLCKKTKKPILKLTERDYNDNGMGDLLVERGTAQEINIRVFNDLQHTITGWPGGKPNADDTYRPERKSPFPKRVLIFSPHPDDDVISMGGTMMRLVEQGHDVYVAYQVSGNLAVSDSDVLRYLDFASDYCLLVKGTDKINFDTERNRIREFIKNKKNDSEDIPEVRAIKGLIRSSEAKDACRFANIKSDNICFLKMPFYETGGTEKKPLNNEDFQIISNIITKIKPHQIYAAGDLSDPHGTHRLCLESVFKAIEKLKNEPWMKDCWVWLYRGAWQEWDIYQIEMAVAISPDELMRKRNAIFKHQSQKDGAMFLGSDSREFWQRAEERNRGTARIYNELGMAEYEAFEAFVRYEFL